MLKNDTICALATAPGVSGLAVVRLSGENAFEIADTCFSGKISLKVAKSHTIHYGNFIFNKTVIDTVTASVYRSPHSYTGENVIEFGCHGGTIISGKIIESLIRSGARLAEAGEFTKRAFLNGKLDLTQAEAVADIIHSSSTLGAQSATRQLLGGLKSRISDIRSSLLRICGLLELELDFSEEDIELVNKATIGNQIDSVVEFCGELIDSFHSSEILRHGFTVGIAGYPNAGKSSLLNALLEKDRAIVSHIPGTTRDYIEDFITVDGILIKVIDTAGLRSTDDAIEYAGITLAKSILAQCNLILVVNDVSESTHFSDELFHSLSLNFPQREILLIHNKIDIAPNLTDKNCITISAQKKIGIKALKSILSTIAKNNLSTQNDVLINTRQHNLLLLVKEQLLLAKKVLSRHESNEFIAFELHTALKLLGEITGETYREDILESVFSQFCIGK